MKGKAILLCIATALVAAGTTLAAPPAGSNPQARKAAVEKIKANQRNFRQPRTMKEADATQARLDDGTVMVAVPTELWNEMSAGQDASGAMRVRESDAANSSAMTSEELAHE